MRVGEQTLKMVDGMRTVPCALNGQCDLFGTGRSAGTRLLHFSMADSVEYIFLMVFLFCFVFLRQEFTL